MQRAQRDERVVHFLVHVPKCAGTTVERHFRKHLGDAFLYAPRWKNPLRDVIGNRYPGLGPAQLDRVRAISGHSLSTGLRACLPGARIRESVILRDPVSWHVSMYNYRLRRMDDPARAPGFGKWYSSVRRNPVSRFLLTRYFEQGVPRLYRLSSRGRLAFLEQRLARFHFVGGLDRTDELIAGLSEELGIPGLAARENAVDARPDPAMVLEPEMLARIRRDNALDQVLHDRWAGRGWQQAALPPTPALPGTDQLSYLVADIRSGMLRELGT